MVTGFCSTNPAFLSTFTPSFHSTRSSSFVSHLSSPPIYTSRHQRRGTGRHGRVRISAAHPDVVIIGGGAAGLSTAFELARVGANVRILTSPMRRPAGLAAAGLLAPNSENLPPDMYALCNASLQMYPSFLSTLRSYAPHHPVPFRSFGDFLLPSLDGRPLAPVSSAASSRLLSADQARLLEPALGPRVSAARVVPADASVDNRRLLSALRAACLSLSVRIDECVVRRLVPTGHQCYSVETDAGLVHASHIVVAAGAWTHSLLPNIPVRPVKGQMLSLALPYNTREERPALQHVLYADNVYIVPREEDRPCFYVGATVEPDDFSTNTTAAGILAMLQNAIAIVPSFEKYEIVETWAGLRPSTPDLAPVIGMTTLPNVSVASGSYRNGILLAPLFAKIASAVARGASSSLSRELTQFLHAFSATRFVENGSPAPSPQNTQAFFQTTQPTEPTPQSETRTPAVKPLVSSTDENRSKPRLFKILKDGTREPVYPPPGWNPDPKGDTEQLDELTEGENAALNGIPVPEPVDGMYGVHSQEENHRAIGNPEAHTFTVSTEESANDQTWHASLETLVENSEGGNEHEIENEDDDDEDSEGGKGVNDAYDDLLLKQTGEDDFHGKKARAANRAFGRKKSRLEKEGSPALSLSDGEVDVFDAAFAAGRQEMMEFERCFDESDPSVLATNRDVALIDSSVTPSDRASSTIGQETEQTDMNFVDLEGLSSDGYF